MVAGEGRVGVGGARAVSGGGRRGASQRRTRRAAPVRFLYIIFVNTYNSRLAFLFQEEKYRLRIEYVQCKHNIFFSYSSPGPTSYYLQIFLRTMHLVFSALINSRVYCRPPLDILGVSRFIPQIVTWFGAYDLHHTGKSGSYCI